MYKLILVSITLIKNVFSDIIETFAIPAHNQLVMIIVIVMFVNTT